MSFEISTNIIERKIDTINQQLPGPLGVYGITLIAFVSQLLTILPIQPGRAIGGDPTKFHYGGVLLANGYAPYLYFWDIKPPLIYHVTAFFALIAPNDPWVQFYLGSFTALVMSVGTIGLVSALVYRMTSNHIAAFCAGITVLGFAKFTTLPEVGVMPKLFCFFFGLSALWFIQSRRWVLAATLATIAAGFWQFGIIFPVLVYGEAFRTGVRKGLLKMAGGSAIVTLVTIGPIVLLGGFTAMVNQVLVTPFVMDDGSKTLLFRASKLYRYTDPLWPVLAVGILGGVYRSLRDARLWWLTVGLGWAGVQLAFLDFDGSPDVMLLVVFAALGIGLTIGLLSNHESLIVGVLVIFISVNALIPIHSQLGVQEHGKFAYENTRAVEQHFVDQRVPPLSCQISQPGYQRKADFSTLAKTCSDVSLGNPTQHGS